MMPCIGNMNNEAQTAISIFDHFFARYRKEMLDDEAEFMPMVKDILDGVSAVSDTPEETRAAVLAHIEASYVSNWVNDSTEQASAEFRRLLKKRP